MINKMYQLITYKINFRKIDFSLKIWNYFYQKYFIMYKKGVYIKHILVNKKF